MRTSMLFFGVRTTKTSTRRRKGSGTGFGKMLSKLDAASNRLARSRPRR